MGKRRDINNVLLVTPPGKVYLWPDGSPAHRKHCTPPLGLAYLAAVLREQGYEVHVLDMLAEGYNNEIIIGRHIVYGLQTEDVLDRISEHKAQVVGISVLYSFLISEVLQLCSDIKKKFPNIPIILGGHHPSGAPAVVMNCEHVDYVMIAEAENSLPMLLEAINGQRPLHEVPNLYYRANGEIKDTLNRQLAVTKGLGWYQYRKHDAGIPLDLDDLPFPAWDLFRMEAYWESSVRIGGGDVVRDRYAVMLSTRGCPHVCYFCLSPLMSGYKGYRMRSIDEVVREIRWLVGSYGIAEIQFLDDNFFGSRTRAKRMLKRLASEFPNLIFSCAGGTEANALDDEMIDLMAEAHFYKALISIEAGDQSLQNALIDKKVNIHRVPHIIDYCRKKGIETRAIFMIGFPGETNEQIKRTLDLAQRLDADDFYLSIVTPLPGSLLHDECVTNNLFVEGFSPDDFRFSAAKIKLPDTSPEELELLRREVWLQAFNERRAKMKTMIDQPVRRFVDRDDYEKVGFTTVASKRD